VLLETLCCRCSGRKVAKPQGNPTLLLLLLLWGRGVQGVVGMGVVVPAAGRLCLVPPLYTPPSATATCQVMASGWPSMMGCSTCVSSSWSQPTSGAWQNVRVLGHKGQACLCADQKGVGVEGVSLHQHQACNPNARPVPALPSLPVPEPLRPPPPTHTPSHPGLYHCFALLPPSCPHTLQVDSEEPAEVRVEAQLHQLRKPELATAHAT
jgi:hypothetical protein